jgi:hypothetical protein
MDLSRDFFVELHNTAVRASRQAGAAFSLIVDALRPAISSIFELGSLLVGRHEGESMENFLERMDRKERARRRYVRRTSRRPR